MAGPRASLRIRPASPADSDAIARLHHLSHTVCFRAFAPAHWVAARELASYERAWRERLDAPPARSRVWTADEDGATIAIACAGPMPADLPGSDASTAQVRSMHIRPDRQGCGIGHAVWHVVIAFVHAQAYARARFDVIEANLRARRFFDLAGARVVARSPTGVEGVPIVTYEYDVRSAFDSAAAAAQR